MAPLSSLTPLLNHAAGNATFSNSSSNTPTDWALMDAATNAATAELFIILLVTSFVLVSVAVLRIILQQPFNHHLALSAHPSVSSSPLRLPNVTTRTGFLSPGGTWGGYRGMFLSIPETDALHPYPTSLSYGATSVIPPHTHTYDQNNQNSTPTHIAALTNPSYETLIEFGDILGVVKTGLTDEQIAVLPSYKYRTIGQSSQSECIEKPCSEETRACAICRDDFLDMDLIRILPCGDEFHVHCIGPWLKQQASCPLCRSRFG